MMDQQVLNTHTAFSLPVTEGNSDPDQCAPCPLEGGQRTRRSSQAEGKGERQRCGGGEVPERQALSS